ncbi:SCO7613 C-terminal domain-containing membrane protein [Phytohabitans aurantiacus]|uniref:Integral membrane protein n=1 Tax=Phytohabitans aurantiacus TaxID=3016789 RepID=A0ABQ5QU30_9ACTN|nr:hypothetical protein [Phytohabitans aurantiacus]GLH97229.1 hypothetical protein Pa4123_25040 [Phytohabitans aurantiacus]
MTYPCPACGAPANLESGCPRCGRGPDPDAAEVIRLNAEIVDLSARLRTAETRRAELAARVRVRARPAPAPQPLPLPVPVPVAATTAAAPRPEASTLTVQSVLFILGGLLLGAAAIVFTGVAWAAYGVGGRAAILAVVTALALSAPLLALRRKLTATAETFAAVGLLLVLLDGYAAWYVNLFGLADWPGTRYAALVCGVTAAVAAGYAVATGLSGPRFAALAVAQPVLPLLAYRADPDAFGWAFVLVAVALLDLVLVWRASGPLHVAGWVAHGLALVLAWLAALGSVLAGSGLAPAIAGVPLVVVASVLLLRALVARSRLLGAVAGAGLVVALGVASLRLVAEVRPSLTLVLMAAVAAVLAAASATAARGVPAPGVFAPAPAQAVFAPAPAPGAAVPGAAVPGAAALGAAALGGVEPASVGAAVRAARFGTRVGAATVAGLVGLVAVVMAGVVAAVSATRALPPWDADLNEHALPYDWQVPVAVVLVAGAVALLMPRAYWRDAAVFGGAFAVLALPLPWWLTPLVGLAAGGGLALVAARLRRVNWAVLGGVLALHAAVASLARPLTGAVVLAAAAVTGVAVAAAGRRSAIGGVGLLAGVLATPAAVAAALVAAEVEPWWVGRGTVAAVATLLLGLIAVRRMWPEHARYAEAGVLALALVIGTLPEVWRTGDPPGVYAAVALVLGAFVVRDRPKWAVLLAPPAIRTVVALAPALWAVLAEPYRWLGDIWSGAPDGGWSVSGPAAATLIVATVAVGLFRPMWTLPLAALAVPVTLAAADAPWPLVPAASLVLGLAGMLTRQRVAFLPLAAAGLVGTLPTKATTLGGLGLVVAVSVAVAASARTVAVRVAGALAAVAAGVAFAFAAAQAAELPLHAAAFAVLAVGVLALAAGGAVTPTLTRPLDAAALSVAALAVLLALGDLRYAAAVAAIWGVAAGGRALWRKSRRVALAMVAASSELLAWWLSLAAGDVTITEAYTLPAAAVALVAGWLALRARPERSSWLAYGPGLAAALLPSLASVLVEDGQPIRRLLLGAGALGAVLAGSVWRRQAPVVLGGVTLVVVTAAELVRVWDLLPRWIFLAAGGFVLIGLAMTYERRRRDLLRLRTSVGRMT